MAVSRQTWRRGGHWAARTTSSAEDTGLKHGFRSGLEGSNAKHLEQNGVPVLFEVRKLKYVIPESLHTYTVDFELPNGVLVETKGKFEPKDRAKHLLIKAQYPDLDLRFVFQRPSDPITKGSKTTYAMWAEKHGFKWAIKLIPQEWMRERGPARKPSEVLCSTPSSS
jgi:hypothetical protein